MKLLAALQKRFFRWALRGPTPEAAPVVLTRQRIFVLPTRFGLCYCLLLLVMLTAAINYNLSLAYAWVFLLAGLGVVCIFHSFRNLVRLRLSPGRNPPVFAGEAAGFALRLENPDERPRPALRVNLPDQSGLEVDLAALGSREITLKLPSSRRGWLAMPRLRLTTTYPMGLIRAWAYAAPAARCLVYPAPQQEEAPPAANPADERGAQGRNRGLEDFSGLRPHQPAEPLHHIAWKTAARFEQGPLLSKVFSGSQMRTVWLDFAALPASIDLETRLSMLAKSVCDLAAEGSRWGLRLPDKTLEADSGVAHYHACLAALALYGLSEA